MVKQPTLYDTSVRKRAVSVMRNAVLGCSEAVGPYKLHVKQLIQPHLQEWLQQFCTTLSKPITLEVCQAFAQASAIHLLPKAGKLHCPCIFAKLKASEATLKISGSSAVAGEGDWLSHRSRQNAVSPIREACKLLATSHSVCGANMLGDVDCMSAIIRSFGNCRQ